MSGEKLSQLPPLGTLASSDLIYVVRGGASFQAEVGLVSGGALLRQTKTANYTLTAADAGTYFDNIGALSEVDFTLPATPSATQVNGFVIAAAQLIKIIAPVGTTISLGSTATTDGGFVSCPDPGANLVLYAVTQAQWVSLSLSGGWSIN